MIRTTVSIDRDWITLLRCALAVFLLATGETVVLRITAVAAKTTAGAEDGTRAGEAFWRATVALSTAMAVRSHGKSWRGRCTGRGCHVWHAAHAHTHGHRQGHRACNVSHHGGTARSPALRSSREIRSNGRCSGSVRRVKRSRTGRRDRDTRHGARGRPKANTTDGALAILDKLRHIVLEVAGTRANTVDASNVAECHAIRTHIALLEAFIETPVDGLAGVRADGSVLTATDSVLLVIAVRYGETIVFRAACISWSRLVGCRRRRNSVRHRRR